MGFANEVGDTMDRDLQGREDEDRYNDDYPRESIRGDNPYWRCVYCKHNTPGISGYIERHMEWYKYRITKEKQKSVTQNDVAINYREPLRWKEKPKRSLT